jgi:hypothetical protein
MRAEEDSELILFRAEMRAHVGTVNENITKVQEQHHTMLQELVSLRTEFTHVKEDVKDLKFDVNGLVERRGLLGGHYLDRRHPVPRCEVVAGGPPYRRARGQLEVFSRRVLRVMKYSQGMEADMAKGGSFRSAADGVAKKGKTKGKQIKMAKGGMAKGCK